MKKKICMLLAVVMMLGLTACGGNEKTSTEDGVYSYKIMGSPSIPVEKDTETEQFIEKKYGIQIDAVSVTASYYEKVAAMLASDEVPDAFFINEPENWQPLADQGFLAEISKETIKKYAPRHYEVIEATDPAIWAISKYKGANWAVPKIMGKENSTVMVWRLDWLNKLGIEKTPVTIEEYEAAYIKIRENDPDGNGNKDTYGLTGSGGATQRQFDAVFGAFGVMPGQWYVKDGVVENYTTSDAAKEALTLLNKWYKMELIDPEMITDNQESHLKKFLAGRIASFNTGLVNISVYSANGARNKRDFEAGNPDKKWEDSVTLGKLPTGKNGECGDWLWGPRANFVVFGEQLEDNKDKFNKLLSVLDDINYDEETALKVVWGEKGVTYDYIDPSVGKESGLTFIAPFDADSNSRASKGLYGFFNLFSPASNWADVNITEGYSNPELKKELEMYSQTENYKDGLMRPYLPSGARYQGELDKLKTTAYSEFITGVRSLEDWNGFVTEYMSKGGEIIKGEAQKFYDENMK